MKNLDHSLLKEFLRAAVQKLEGEWVLVGGTLLPAIGIDIRSTVDIDLIGLGDTEAAQSIRLMEIAESLGLPVETVNQAAAYYLEKAGYEKTDLIPLQMGRRCKIFRPSLPLYWRLKAARLTESDALDCQHYLQYCRGQGDAFDIKKLKTWLSRATREAGSSPRGERLRKLHELL